MSGLDTLKVLGASVLGFFAPVLAVYLLMRYGFDWSDCEGESCLGEILFGFYAAILGGLAVGATVGALVWLQVRSRSRRARASEPPREP